jgi:hypothetical protein
MKFRSRKEQPTAPPSAINNQGETVFPSESEANKKFFCLFEGEKEA